MDKIYQDTFDKIREMEIALYGDKYQEKDKSKKDEIKKSKPKNNKLGKRGIYAIYCEKTNRCYIGQSVNIQSRIRSHRRDLELNKKTGKIQEDYNAYPDEFVFCVIEETDLDLFEAETYWTVELHKIGVELYNKIIHTKTSIVQAPESMKGVVLKICKWLDRGMITEKQLEEACLKIMENSFY